MKIVSYATHTNNSRVTLQFTDNEPMRNADTLAQHFGCSWSHNVRINLSNGNSFGTISWNKGNHASALTAFLTSYNRYAKH